MHVSIVAPVSVRALADLLDPSDREVAAAEPPYSATSPVKLVHALVSAGCYVSVVTQGNGSAPLRLQGSNIEVHRVPSRSRERHRTMDAWSRERRSMADLVGHLQPDVVHAHWAYECALAALSSGYPTVITIRDAPLTVVRYRPDVQRFVRLTLAIRTRFAQGRAVLTAPSPYMASAWRRQMMTRADIRVIPNIAPNARIGPRKKSAFPSIIEVADDGRRKNVPSLLRAFRLVREELPDARLRLFGHGLGPAGHIAQFARRNGLVDGVEFNGSVPNDEVQAAMGAAWLHVHAATEESFGNTLVEAMSMGTPVMGGRRSAAVPWVLAEGAAGFLTDVSDPKRMARDILSALRDESARRRKEQAAAARVATVFGADGIARETIDTYKAAIARSAE
jgi:glycosyltransferase involved in cell wall biosynthesis